MSALLQDSSSLYDDIRTPERESRSDIVAKSMQDALLFLSDSLGQETLEWRWEQLHTLSLKPPLFAQAAEEDDAPKALKLIVSNLLSKGPYPVAGHGMSVNNAQYRWDQPFEMTLGPSIRRIVDLSRLGEVRTVIPTGQSANPLSQHFGDQTDLWLNGRYRSLIQDSSLFRKAEIRTMKLLPADS